MGGREGGGRGRAGDEVLITARSPHSVRTTVAELRRDIGPDIKVTGATPEPCAQVHACGG